MGSKLGSAVQRWTIPVALILACIPGAALGASAEGESLPELELVDVESGEKKQAAALLRGSVGAIVYMQTSCAACRKELMALKEIQVEFPELKVVVISVDSGNPARVKRYMEHFEFTFPFLHDPEFKTPELFGFSFTPALVLTDKKGQIALLKGGYRPGDEVELERRITALLEQ
jgi:peroxiredoxin